MNELTPELEATLSRVRNRLIKESGPHTVAYLEGMMREIGKEIVALRAELASRGEFVDRGVWKQGLIAKTGNGCTHEGSFWIAQKTTMSRPGVDDHWRLAVKRGRDAKGA